MHSCFPPLATLSIRDKPLQSPTILNSQPPVVHRKSLTSYEDEHKQNGGKIEILEDLDLYYIRQIAHNRKEYDLEQKIDLEIKMREGTTKLLAACKHQAQTLEAAKNLLTSNERMSAYMAELQRRKKDMPPPRMNGISGCKARVSLSDIRLPLMWRDSDYFKNKGDYRRFAVFCLVRSGTELYDTSLLCPVDRSHTDLTFQDVLLFTGLSPDFNISIEVYSHMLQDDLSMASTPRKIKKTIHSSISRTVGKKLALSIRDELNSGKIGPHFELMASARLTLDDSSDSVHTHDLKLENSENPSHQLPLFGHYCCRLAVQPDNLSRESHAGFVKVRASDARSAEWRQVWAQLAGFQLRLWEDKDQYIREDSPLRTVVVDRETRIKGVSGSCKEIEISNTVEENREETLHIRTDTADEKSVWLRHLTQHSKDHLRWKHTVTESMDIKLPSPSKIMFNKPARQGSLYDETPLIENIENHRDYQPRRTAQEVFSLTPSTSLSSCSSSSSPTFRDRSLSTSSKTRSGRWPFSRNN
ncbi:hypothetical protein M8J75_003945 [Diaphorina citri]|nr:hypothetical protein M8J75_003945 [Diaphorina citri]